MLLHCHWFHDGKEKRLKHSRILVLGLVIFLFLAAYATAQNSNGLYINAKWGKTDANGNIGNVSDSLIGGDDDAQAYEVGWRFSGLVAVQVGYHDLGTLPGTLEAKTTAYSLTFVPQIPLTRSISLSGKVGVVALESDVSAILDDTATFAENLSDEDIIYGAGVKLRFVAGLSLFYEYEFLGSDLEVQSLGASWQF